MFQHPRLIVDRKFHKYLITISTDVLLYRPFLISFWIMNQRLED